MRKKLRCPQATSPAPSEGWQAEKYSNLRVFHYIRDTFALCEGLGFYRGELVEGGLTPSTNETDCAKCRRLVDKELAVIEKRPLADERAAMHRTSKHENGADR